jgi:hypothetical protein
VVVGGGTSASCRNPKAPRPPRPPRPQLLPLQIGYQGADFDAIRLAIADAWSAGDNVIGGPVIYDLSNVEHPSSGGNPDSPIGLTTVRRIWAALDATFYGGTFPGRGPQAVSATYDPVAGQVTVTFNQSLALGLAMSPALKSVLGGTVTAVGQGTQPDTILLTVSGQAPASVSFALGSTTAGKVPPAGTDILAPDGAVIDLPAEPFAGLAVGMG